MASWNSPRVGPYRDSSPTSPLTPLSPSSLPLWLRKTRPRTAIFSNGRVKIVVVALTCMFLGWFITSSLGPEGYDINDEPYDLASGGTVNSASGFGDLPKGVKRPGIIGENENGTFPDLVDQESTDKKPSVSGALAELHQAVSDKLQAWNPYFVKTSRPPINETTESRHKSTSNTTGLLAGETVADGFSEEEGLGARIRIGKCTILFGGNSYWERAIKSHERHNREHGYRLHVLRQDLLDDVWSKPAYILSLLLRELAKPAGERLEWLFWVDADTVILNPHIPIDVFLPPPGTEFDEIHLMYSNDWNGLNNGVFPVRVNQWSALLFSSIVAYRHFRPEDPLLFRDQSAMDTLMREPRFAKSVVEAPQRWFNAYQGEHNETLAPWQIRRGDFLVHFAGVPAREERMGYWLERAEQQQDDWQIPLKSTSYPQEVRDFWEGQRQARASQREEQAETRLKATKMLEKTDQQTADYGDRLDAETAERISVQKDVLRKMLENEELSAQREKVIEATAQLEAVAAPLTAIIADAQRLLLAAAHGAIFGGEKDLLDGGFHEGKSSPELTRVSEGVQALKALVMAPPESWDRAALIGQTDSLTESRAALQLQLQIQAQIQAQIEAQALAQAEAAGALAEAPVFATGVVSEEVPLPTGLSPEGLESATGISSAVVDPAMATEFVAYEQIAPGDPALVAATETAVPEEQATPLAAEEVDLLGR